MGEGVGGEGQGTEGRVVGSVGGNGCGEAVRGLGVFEGRGIYPGLVYWFHALLRVGGVIGIASLSLCAVLVAG